MPQVVLDQKRLETLRRQLQGKEQSYTKYTLDKKHVSSSNLSHSTEPLSTSTNYLRRDMLKILILSTLAIGVQLCLYLSLSKNLIHF